MTGRMRFVDMLRGAQGADALREPVWSRARGVGLEWCMEEAQGGEGKGWSDRQGRTEADNPRSGTVSPSHVRSILGPVGPAEPIHPADPPGRALGRVEMRGDSQGNGLTRSSQSLSLSSTTSASSQPRPRCHPEAEGPSEPRMSKGQYTR